MLGDNLIDIVHKDYYFSQAVQASHGILNNILCSGLQDKYRQYMAEYRNISKKVLEDSYMFYILDGEEELDEVVPSLVDRDILGLQSGDFVRQALRFVFPLMTPDRVIAGWVGYDYEEEKYKYLMSFAKFAEKGRMFFNWVNIDKGYKEDVCIIVEGVFDSLRLNELGFYNNVGLLGKRVTEYQKRILNRFSLLVLIPDNDVPGEKACSEWVRMLRPKKAVVELKKGEFSVDTPRGLKKVWVKDIDDFLQKEENKDNFREVYKKIIADAKEPFYDIKRYKI